MRVALILSAWMIVPLSVCAQFAPKANVRIMIPLYEDPTIFEKDWNTVLSSASEKVPIIIIANPDSGPGKADHPSKAKFEAFFQKARSNKNICVLGYIASNYGKKDGDAQVDTWLKLYSDSSGPLVSGIFIDEQSSDRAGVGYYVKLCNTIRRKMPKALIVANPGTDCDAVYLSGEDNKRVADIVLIHEKDEKDNPFSDFQLSQGMKFRQFKSDRFAAAVYNAGKDKLKYVDSAVKANVGSIYITDQLYLLDPNTSKVVTDSNGKEILNPWCRLPIYWRELVNKVARVNGTK
jgi:hypothetical protein